MNSRVKARKITQSKESKHNEYQIFLRQEELNLTADNHKLKALIPIFSPTITGCYFEISKDAYSRMNHTQKSK